MHGLTGPVDSKTYPQVMVAMGSNKDQWIADVVSYIRNSFGNTGAFATAQDVARIRTATVDRTAPWTATEIETSLPRLLVPSESWKVTASHEGHPAPQANAEGGYNYRGNAAGALTFMGWTTGESQRPDMWWQLELPAPVMLTEIQFASSTVGTGAKQTSTFPRCVSSPGLGRRSGVEHTRCRRPGWARHGGDHFRARQRKVRADHTNGEYRRRAAVGDAAAAPVRGAA